MLFPHVGPAMKALVIGAGGVGRAIVNIASRKSFITSMVIADRTLSRAEEAVVRVKDSRFSAAEVNAAELEDIRALIRKVKPDVVVNAVDPRFVMPIFLACEIESTNYIHLFSVIDSITIFDGSNLTVEGYEFAPSFSIWTTIEECLNPPLVWEDGRGWFTTEPFSEIETFDFPEGIGPVECVNVEHEEVVLIPQKVDAKKVNFKYGLGAQFITTLKTIHMLGMDRKENVDVQGISVSPRDLLAASLPDPATIGSRMKGKTCAGALVKGLNKDGKPYACYMYNVIDNEWSMAEYGDQAVVWQTAVNPVIAMELIHKGIWKPEGVAGPEWFDAKPFLDSLESYGTTWKIREENI